MYLSVSKPTNLRANHIACMEKISFFNIYINFHKHYQHIIKRVGFENVNKMITIIKKFSKLIIPLR